MIKVLHFVSVPARWSGVMSVIMNYYRHLDRSRIQFDFLCFIHCEDSYEEEIRTLGGRVFFISKPGLKNGSIEQIENFLQENRGRYQWFHNHEVYLSFLLRPLARKCGVPGFIIHSHATKYSDRRLAAIRNKILCIPIGWMKCDKFACSNAAGEFLYGKNSLAKKKFRVMPNAIDPQVYVYNENNRNKYRTILGVQSAFTIIHIGRFAPQKNHRFLLTFFANLSKEMPDVKLVMVGDGPLKADMELYTEQAGITEKVLFLGQRNDVPELLQAADLFVLPSLYEGLPIACLEAEAAGLPCLVSDEITKEVCLSNDIQLLSIDDEKCWIEACERINKLMEKKDYKRSCTCTEKLPNITVEAKKLTDFYEMRS